MRRSLAILLGLALGLAAPASASAMLLSDPEGDVAREDVDIVGGEIALKGGDLVVRFKLAGPLRLENVYTVRIQGENGERWRLRAVRQKGSALSARDEVRKRSFRARGVMVNRLVAISFPAARMGAGQGRFRFSLSAAAPGDRAQVDTLPAGGRPKGRALVTYRP